ncbi:glycogen debranching enzyme family protein [Candidatus Bathyarchaeota archaeon]|nr:glycogen debranching enzyme family protein [Candidatus Bathyarchaeota archaeon]
MELPFISLSRKTLSDVDEALNKEWIITNGLGGYASSTVLGINTRKYHGLLVAAFRPPRERRVCLAKLDDEIILDGQRYPCFSNEFQTGFSPSDQISIQDFSLEPLPTYTYKVEDFTLKKTIFMIHGKNTTACIYEVAKADPREVELRVYPLITFRHFHSVIDHHKETLCYSQKATADTTEISFTPQGVLFLKAVNGIYQPSEKWVERVYFRGEFNRGESFLDDWLQPGFFKFYIDKNYEKCAVIAYALPCEGSAEPRINTLEDTEAFYRKELKRRQELLTRFYTQNMKARAEDWLSFMIQAADMFIVETAEKACKSIIAGYHWFEDWGRDTFIALPGLMLVTGRFEEARKVLRFYAGFFHEGLIPNYVSDFCGEARYNAVDATLWYVNAVLQYLKYTGDFNFVHEILWNKLKAIVDCFQQGTLFNIRVDDDGLLMHGPQLTWMDAVVDGQPVTPRAGKAVEVQALWYNALKSIEALARRFKEASLAEKYGRLAEKAKVSFRKKFWDPARHRLFDVLDERGCSDPSPRPNQILAAALDFTMLDRVEADKIVDFVHRELLTPFGLRSLAKSDPRYMGVYWGDRRSRDLAYHNGTVWPWLMGPFVTAYLKVKGYNELNRQYAFENFLQPLFTMQIRRAGLGAISEIFDGDPPHHPRGCIAQAWSVAEPLRAYVEDVLQIRPKHEWEILAAGFNSFS